MLKPKPYIQMNKIRKEVKNQLQLNHTVYHLPTLNILCSIKYCTVIQDTKETTLKSTDLLVLKEKVGE